MHTECPKRAVQVTLDVDFVRRHAYRKNDDDLWHSLNDLGCRRGNSKQEKNEDDPALARHGMDYKLSKLIAGGDRIQAMHAMVPRRR